MAWHAAISTIVAQTTSSLITAYAPLIVAVAGLGTAVIAALSRRDKRTVDQSTNMDAHTNTAIRGLTEAYDRLEKERAREEHARIEADRLAGERKDRITELEEELRTLRGNQNGNTQ